MTEVPEHLLKRSRDRRAALGLGGGGGGEAPATPSEPAEGGAEVEPAGATAAAAPAAAAPAEVEATPPEPVPPYVEAALRRKRIPFWAMPVVGLLPIWIILYAGSLSPADTGELTQLDLGAEIYAANCSTCHGPTGDGNTITASRHRYANLIDGVWRSDGSLEALERQIRFGRDPMPRFQGKLTDEEIRQTAAFVLEMSRVAGATGAGEGSSR